MALKIFRGQRLYDDEQPLNKNTPDFDYPRPIDNPAPYTVLVQGPHNVGKSMLIRSLIDFFLERPSFYPVHVSHSSVANISFAAASGKDIRLQFVECPDDINGMIDAAKYADVAILMVDASFGFEMETFEFRNLLQVHGFPKVIGVLTHLDKVDPDEMTKVKKRLQDHFCTEIYEGAKLFSLSGLEDGLYKKLDGLGEMLSDSQFLPLSWRAEHPYVLVDHFEFATPERVHGDKPFNRILRLYGHLRGCDIKKGAKVHIAGAGDFSLAGVTRSDADDPFGCRVIPGNYLRLDVLDVPPEIVAKFDRNHPILVGGIPLEEEKSGFMMAKLRRHSWHWNLLMSGIPITVSAGWRRYQTNAIYAMENENGQHRLLEYTPEHKDCLAVFWGPLASPKTRIVAVLNKFYFLNNKQTFRIMAKGVVLDFNRDAQILLKVKRIGTPLAHTGGNTACIRFAQGLESDWFVGAPIQTNSGIQGTIDEAVEQGVAICTFKDNIPKGDTFLFPIFATLVLPSIFKRLNLLCKPSETAADLAAAAAAAFTAIYNAYTTAAYNAYTSAAYNAYTATDLCVVDPAVSVEDELAVSYNEVALRMLDLRRGVVIHEGKRAFLSFPNRLELGDGKPAVLNSLIGHHVRARAPISGDQTTYNVDPNMIMHEAPITSDEDGGNTCISYNNVSQENLQPGVYDSTLGFRTTIYAITNRRGNFIGADSRITTLTNDSDGNLINEKVNDSTQKIYMIGSNVISTYSGFNGWSLPIVFIGITSYRHYQLQLTSDQSSSIYYLSDLYLSTLPVTIDLRSFDDRGSYTYGDPEPKVVIVGKHPDSLTKQFPSLISITPVLST